MPEKRALKRAVIIGATSGIGEAIARALPRENWSLGLAGRRSERLEVLRNDLGGPILTKTLDVDQLSEAIKHLETLVQDLGGMDLLVISAGISRRGASPEQEQMIIRTNVTGFTGLARWGFDYFTKQKSGHLVGISSISAIRGRAENVAYSASKAYLSNYLQGLRQKAFRARADIAVTDVLAGWVDTPLIRGSQGRHFWVASPEKAAAQIVRAISRRKKTIYVTRRWRLLGWFLKLIPDWLHQRI